jgi:hypothetical protein
MVPGLLLWRRRRAREETLTMDGRGGRLGQHVGVLKDAVRGLIDT